MRHHKVSTSVDDDIKTLDLTVNWTNSNPLKVNNLYGTIANTKFSRSDYAEMNENEKVYEFGWLIKKQTKQGNFERIFICIIITNKSLKGFNLHFILIFRAFYCLLKGVTKTPSILFNQSFPLRWRCCGLHLGFFLSVAVKLKPSLDSFTSDFCDHD